MSVSGAGSGRARNSRKSGVMMTCGGSRLPAVNSISRRELKRQLKRETAKAIIDARNSTRKTAGTMIDERVQEDCGISAWFQALM